MLKPEHLVFLRRGPSMSLRSLPPLTRQPKTHYKIKWAAERHRLEQQITKPPSGSLRKSEVLFKSPEKFTVRHFTLELGYQTRFHWGPHQPCSGLQRAKCNFFFFFFLIFIVIQLQLYAFSPHPSTHPR